MSSIEYMLIICFCWSCIAEHVSVTCNSPFYWSFRQKIQKVLNYFYKGYYAWQIEDLKSISVKLDLFVGLVFLTNKCLLIIVFKIIGNPLVYIFLKKQKFQ